MGDDEESYKVIKCVGNRWLEIVKTQDGGMLILIHWKDKLLATLVLEAKEMQILFEVLEEIMKGKK